MGQSRSLTVLLIVVLAIVGYWWLSRSLIPGERVGPLALGMTQAQLAAAMGGPGEVLHQGGATTYSWGQVAAEIGDNSPGVELITVNDPRYETPGHIRVGLAALAAAAVLGQ